MHIENAMDIQERRIEYLQRCMQDMVSYQQVMSVSMGVVKLIDGTGRAHGIPMTFAMSFEVRGVKLDYKYAPMNSPGLVHYN